MLDLEDLTICSEGAAPFQRKGYCVHCLRSEIERLRVKQEAFDMLVWEHKTSAPTGKAWRAAEKTLAEVGGGEA